MQGMALTKGGSSARPRVPQKEGAKQEERAGGARAAGADKGAAEPLPRKIIYKAEVSLVVDDLPAAEEQLRQLINQHKGFIAKSELSGSTGSKRSGHWRLRVPVDGFDAFMAAVVKLGVPQVNRTDSQDVTDQYYDLEARIKNKKAEEESLRKLLEQTHGKMEDILAVRRELNQVRGDIDLQEGQLRRLANLSALTTVDLTLQEIKDYVPPETPTFGKTIADTFGGSIDVLKAVGRGLVLVGVALAPWLPLLLVIGVPLWVMWRRRRPLAVVPAPPSVPSPAPPAG
jgi:hypothetical protein